ncbi:hypothetical protein ACFL96_06715, partial [Thermoproteota archaeon]
NPSGESWGDGHIYNYDCGGPVWKSGVNFYILKRNGESLYVKRVPQGETINNQKVGSPLSLNITNCKNLADKHRRAEGGGAQSVLKK